MQIGILEPEDFSPQAIDILETVGQVQCFDGENVGRFVEDKEVLFIRLKHMVDADLLARAGRLRYICSPTTGLNHVDMVATDERNITVLSLSGEKEFLSDIRATPEHALGLTLALLRNYERAFLGPANAVWNRDRLKGDELFRNKVGIVGFGRVGRILAKYFHCFGSEVFFYDIDPAVGQGSHAVRKEDLTSLFSAVNIVVLAASYSEERGICLGKDQLDLLEGKYLINISRGELIDEDHLLDMIQKGAFKGIALDVIARENAAGNNLSSFLELAGRGNFILTPHVGGATYGSMARTEEFIAFRLLETLGAVRHSS